MQQLVEFRLLRYRFFVISIVIASTATHYYSQQPLEIERRAGVGAGVVEEASNIMPNTNANLREINGDRNNQGMTHNIFDWTSKEKPNATEQTHHHNQQPFDQERRNSFGLVEDASSTTYKITSNENNDDTTNQEIAQSDELIQEESKTIQIPQNKQNEDDRPLPCTLRSRPAPMILMSLGRSGTASMYQVLSKLSGTGEDVPRIIEYTGSSTPKSKKFFEKDVRADDVNGDWLIEYICRKQRHHPDAGMVGFKWKPYETIFTEEKAKQGLELLARLGRSEHDGPHIKVIRSRRNLVDVAISR